MSFKFNNKVAVCFLFSLYQICILFSCFEWVKVEPATDMHVANPTRAGGTFENSQKHLQAPWNLRGTA